jgi:hypothetical protein
MAARHQATTTRATERAATHGRERLVTSSLSAKVFTFKEGLLSRLAHDLQLTLGACLIEVAAGKVTARFALRSLRVDGAVAKGRVTSALKADDKASIERTMASELLDVDRHPEARFEGELGERRGTRVAVTGQLSLAGRQRPLAASVELGDAPRCELELKPSEFGIAPYRAMGGALKVQDRVRIELTLDPPEAALDDLGNFEGRWVSQPEAFT